VAVVGGVELERVGAASLLPVGQQGPAPSTRARLDVSVRQRAQEIRESRRRDDASDYARYCRVGSAAPHRGLFSSEK